MRFTRRFAPHVKRRHAAKRILDLIYVVQAGFCIIFEQSESTKLLASSLVYISPQERYISKPRFIISNRAKGTVDSTSVSALCRRRPTTDFDSLNSISFCVVNISQIRTWLNAHLDFRSHPGAWQRQEVYCAYTGFEPGNELTTTPTTLVVRKLLDVLHLFRRTSSDEKKRRPLTVPHYTLLLRELVVFSIPRLSYKIIHRRAWDTICPAYTIDSPRLLKYTSTDNYSSGQSQHFRLLAIQHTPYLLLRVISDAPVSGCSSCQPTEASGASCEHGSAKHQTLNLDGIKHSLTFSWLGLRIPSFSAQWADGFLGVCESQGGGAVLRAWTLEGWKFTLATLSANRTAPSRTCSLVALGCLEADLPCSGDGRRLSSWCDVEVDPCIQDHDTYVCMHELARNGAPIKMAQTGVCTLYIPASSASYLDSADRLNGDVTWMIPLICTVS
ncbi:hypothetical protein ACRALDRAFT_208778 [Sodiomyces alcalophilus JCM 7366]|uniref:uncharacterized protein n=1 Tax=Sodiomyces alcalophilus JCM 7366 TaxID=591952 RepID=UPI0039B3DEDA